MSKFTYNDIEESYENGRKIYTFRGKPYCTRHKAEQAVDDANDIQAYLDDAQKRFEEDEKLSDSDLGLNR